jgi:hypothetical protein
MVADDVCTSLWLGFIVTNYYANASLDVANCNITTIDHITDEVAEDFLQHSPTLAANFIRLSPEAPHGRRRFLLSAEAKTCYPDDDEFGRTWLETGEIPSGEVDEEGK